MPITKAPLLSFKASQTIGDKLTFQKRGNRTIARTKPVPTDPKALPQIYHRWLYQDYCAYWNTLTPAQKQVYTTLAKGKALTPFNYFMRVMLNTLPDIALYLHMDTIVAGKTPDSSKNANHATVVGASLTKGRINNALTFPGAADYVNAGNTSSLQLTDKLSILAFAYIPTSATKAIVDHSASTSLRRQFIWQDGLGIHFGSGSSYWTRGSTILIGRWNFLALTFDKDLPSANFKAYIHGLLVGTANFTSPFPTPTLNFLIAHSLAPGMTGYNFNGQVDHVIFYNRILSPTDMLRHAKRQFPA